MKKVLIIVGTPLVNAGVPRVMMDIFERLNNFGYTFDFLTLSKELGYWDNKIISMGGKVYYGGVKKRNKNKIKYALYMLIRPWQVYRVIKSGGYDIVHSNCGYLSGWDMLISKLCGVKKRVTHAHGTYRATSINLKVGATMLDKFATNRIACSRIAGETLFMGKDFQIILNSVDFTPYSNLNRKKHKEINLLQVGYFCGIKNQLFTLEICKELLGRGLDVHVYMIGFDMKDGYLQAMNTYIEENNLQGTITFLPHDYDKFEIYPIIDFSLMPSKSEGLPVVAIESQAAGIPCLASMAVPEDVDMGGLKRLSLENINDWIDTIISGSAKVSLYKESLLRFSREAFIEGIESVYTE